jgi:hypothetical protein
MLLEEGVERVEARHARECSVIRRPSALTCVHASALQRVCSITRRTRLMRSQGCQRRASFNRFMSPRSLQALSRLLVVERLGALRFEDALASMFIINLLKTNSRGNPSHLGLNLEEVTLSC